MHASCAVEALAGRSGPLAARRAAAAAARPALRAPLVARPRTPARALPRRPRGGAVRSLASEEAAIAAQAGAAAVPAAGGGAGAGAGGGDNAANGKAAALGATVTEARGGEVIFSFGKPGAGENGVSAARLEGAAGAGSSGGGAQDPAAATAAAANGSGSPSSSASTGGEAGVAAADAAGSDAGSEASSEGVSPLPLSTGGGFADAEEAEEEASSAAAAAAPAPPGPAAPPQVVMSSGASMLPHPEKAHRGGEDAFFISDPPLAVGVADGVGGWAEIGVDAGAYARLLMSHAKEEAEALLREPGAGPLSPQTVLERAYYRTNVQGSSTACVLALNGSTLCASNLGDSGFAVVRDGAAAFQSPQQQHNFNFPYQLGSADGGASDHPQSAMRFELTVRPGDILILGSDGLWDNVFAEEAATVVSRCRAQGDGPEAAAHTLCRYARMRASDTKYHSPFSYAACAAGYFYQGGKMDDLTVVVSYITAAGSKI
ncbi:phosphatase 2C-like [Raphidocelis subcapitata]|uniref:Protein phosphatase n=1 Tax=Raphidocelis subcapitata TaxID=307507 RepID=A0A2V0PIM4_9CHLO|nr:phosphatase 2C-like [Raphidocelis subcapitata]|eukprot:GBF96905.1 phosphatase 2C-like [Raphidocelis subcapitata]